MLAKCFSRGVPASTVCIPRILQIQHHAEKKTKIRKPKSYPVLPCHVCKEKAGKHSYYGGQACTSCRAYFRRAVQSASYQGYLCIKDGKCEILLKTRKKCQYCRYQACLAAGMKPVWVLNEEEKKKFLESRKRHKKSKTKLLNNPASPLILRPIKLISDAEQLQVNSYVKTSGYFEMSKVNDMETSLIRDIIR